MSSLFLATNRLLLRPLSFDDAAAIQKLASDRIIADTTISIPDPYPDSEAKRYISKQIAEQQEGYSVTFAITLKPECNFQGIIQLRDIEKEHSVAELSFWLAVTTWGKGYMSEAIKPILNFAFLTLSLNKVYAYHMVRNPASGKVLQKNGFQIEGLLRQRVKKWGVFEDVKLLLILYDEWQNQNINYQ